MTNEDGAHGGASGPVIVVTGPTAGGKTTLALELAERVGGEVVNADSMQVYRYMDIGTAKPTLEQRGRVPHHLFDIVLPSDDYSAGRYAEDARAIAREIHRRGKVVLLTGGTGLYIRAFLEGLVETGAADAALRSRLEAEYARDVKAGDPDRLHRLLAERDAEAASRIHPHDVRRIIRALEIAHAAGGRASDLRARHGFADRPFRSLHLAVDPGRDVVSERIDQRCHDMIEQGLLREVRHLRNEGYGPELRSMRAIGYRHINPVVDGIDTLANAVVAMQSDTRRFARRQRTWLRKVDDVVWVDPADREGIHRRVDAFLASLR